ncbi:MAG TPA: NRDE family protein [Steroidobacteraceae bacterium]|jgi:uncharacterized protein with NRDE domain|nr:NRDE family protein [Steroidobacteraceae bacterium]
MCLLVLAWQSHPRYRLVVAANRDEFHDRPAAPLAHWPPPADILAGRDLRANGTWLGVDRQRRFGVVTNFRELQPARTGAPSRGGLIPAYLQGAADPSAFFAALSARAAEYSGFNLLLADQQSLWYGSNRATPFARALAPGVYGLSNELLDTPWPKLERVRTGFRAWLAGADADREELFRLLADRAPAAEGTHTSTGGLPREWARALSAPFVLHPDYGTRCSSVLLLQSDGALSLCERRFDAQGELCGEREFALKDRQWP